MVIKPIRRRRRKKSQKNLKGSEPPRQACSSQRMDRLGERGEKKKKKNKKRKKAKKHAENYLQWQWCNSDNEIRITTHWRKLNLHFFTINCERGRLVSGRYSCDMNMKQVATTATFTYTQRQPSESVEVNERKKRRKEKKLYTEHQNKYFIYVYIALCLSISFAPPLSTFFIRFFISQCVSFVLFFPSSFENLEWRVMMRWYPVIVIPCEWQHENDERFEKTRKRVEATHKKLCARCVWHDGSLGAAATVGMLLLLAKTDKEFQFINIS